MVNEGPLGDFYGNIGKRKKVPKPEEVAHVGTEWGVGMDIGEAVVMDKSDVAVGVIPVAPQRDERLENNITEVFSVTSVLTSAELLQQPPVKLSRAAEALESSMEPSQQSPRLKISHPAQPEQSLEVHYSASGLVEDTFVLLQPSSKQLSDTVQGTEQEVEPEHPYEIIIIDDYFLYLNNREGSVTSDEDPFLEIELEDIHTTGPSYQPSWTDIPNEVLGNKRVRNVATTVGLVAARIILMKLTGLDLMMMMMNS